MLYISRATPADPTEKSSLNINPMDIAEETMPSPKPFHHSTFKTPTNHYQPP